MIAFSHFGTAPKGGYSRRAGPNSWELALDSRKIFTTKIENLTMSFAETTENFGGFGLSCDLMKDRGISLERQFRGITLLNAPRDPCNTLIYQPLRTNEPVTRLAKHDLANQHRRA